MPPLLEVIVSSLEDARAAAEGGADRLEIVRDLRAGGLTPPIDLVRAIAAEIELPLRVMLRENDGYDLRPGELEPLRRAAAEFVAFGLRDPIGAIDAIARVRQIDKILTSGGSGTPQREFASSLWSDLTPGRPASPASSG